MAKRCRTWILLSALALFVVGTGRAGAAPGVTITNPSQIAITISSPLTVSASVTSTLDIASVKVRVGNVMADLAPIPNLPGQWTTVVDITGVPYGPATVTVTATDLANATGSAMRTFTHDEPPTITITAPAINTVARPMLHVAATCTDDDPNGGCMSLVASAGNGQSTSGVAMVDANLDLTASDGSARNVTFTARDRANRERRIVVPIFVEASPDLTEVIAIGRRVLDIDGTRVLYVDVAGMVHVRRRSDGQDTAIGPIADAGTVPAAGYLTSTGAAFVSMPGSADAELFAWRGNGPAVLVDAFSVQDGDAWQIRGDWAYSRVFGGVDRVNLATGATSTAVCPAMQPNPLLSPAYAPNGTVLCPEMSPNDIMLVTDRGGVRAPFATVPQSGMSTMLFDGTVVTYVNGQGVVSVAAGGPVVQLGDLPNMQFPRLQFDVGGAWVAYTKRSMTSSAMQIWRRGPDGTPALLTPFAMDSVVDGVAGDGSTLVITGGQTRYLSVGDPMPAHVGSELGAPRMRSDGLYIVLGRSALKYGGTWQPVIDAGLPVDATEGDLDAGADGGSMAQGDGGSCGGCGTGGAPSPWLALAGLALLRRRGARRSPCP